MQARCGLPPEELRERIRATGLVPQFETGLIESKDFVERLSTEVGLDVSYDEFCDIWSSIFERRTLIPDHLLEALHANYRLVLVSNTNAIHFEMVRENYPLLRHFDAYILSYEVKAMKPSPVIFEAAIAAAGCPADQCFFTDDIAEYVEAAKACGIDAVQFQDCGQWERELRARGAVWDS
jgi:putative hydrolase of the HAD superfamily